MTNEPRRLGRSILALFTGFVFVVVFSLGTDMGLHAAGIFPALGQPMNGSLFLLATIYRTIYQILGSYFTAKLAPYRPMLHALIGGFIGLTLSIIGMVSTWNKGREFGPHWYPIALTVLALPTAWAGGKLYEMKSNAALRT